MPVGPVRRTIESRTGVTTMSPHVVHLDTRPSRRIRLDRRVLVAWYLKLAAVSLLAAYGAVCFVLATTDRVLYDGFVEFGVWALAAAGAGWLVPRLVGLLLVVSGAALGPATWLVARSVGGNYASSVGARVLVTLFAVPVVAGAMLLLAAHFASRPETRRAP